MISKATGNQVFKNSSRVDSPMNRPDDSVLVRMSKELSLWATKPQICLNKLLGRNFRVRDARERDIERAKERERERKERARESERERGAYLDRQISRSLHDPL